MLGEHFFIINKPITKHLYLSCKKLGWYRDRVIRERGAGKPR